MNDNVPYQSSIRHNRAVTVARRGLPPLGPDPLQWPAEERYLFLERAGMKFDSGASWPEADRDAEAEIRALRTRGEI
jgi:hypothetical protein